MAQVVDSAKFDFLTDLKDLNALIEKLKKVAISTNELGEATKYLNTLNVAFAKEQRALAAVINTKTAATKSDTAEINKSTAAKKEETSEINKTASATRAATAEIQRKRAELKLQNDQLRTTTTSTTDYRGSIDLLKGSLMSFGAVLGISSLTEFTGNIFNAQSEVQKFKLSLDALLGNKEISAGLFEDITKFITESPFQFENTVTNVQKLISSFRAVGMTAEKIKKELVPTLESLGNSASALGLGDEGLKRLIYAFTQVQAAGKLMGTELRQINETGIPMMSLLAEQTGIKIEDMSKAISDGKIKFDVFKEAILSAGKAGGVFAGLMDIQAQTVTGRVSNLKDEIFFAMARIGDSLEGAGKSVISFASSFVESMFGTEESTRKTVSALYDIIRVFGFYKLSMLAIDTVNKVLAKGQELLNEKIASTITQKQAAIATAVESIAVARGEAASTTESTLAIHANNEEKMKAIQLDIELMNSKNLLQQKLREEILLSEQKIAEQWKEYEANLILIKSNKDEVISKNELIAATKREIISLNEKLTAAERVIVTNRQSRIDKANNIKAIEAEILAKKQLIITTEIEINEIKKLNLELKAKQLAIDKTIAKYGQQRTVIEQQIIEIEKEIVAIEKKIGVDRAAAMQAEESLKAIDKKTEGVKSATTWYGKAGLALGAWGKSMLATLGPMAAMTAAIYVVTKAYDMFADAQQQQIMSSTGLIKANNEEINALNTKKLLVNQNVESLSKLKEGSDEYKASADSIIKQFPEYFKGMNASTAKQGDFNAAIDRGNKLLTINIELLARQAQVAFYTKDLEKSLQTLSKAGAMDITKGFDLTKAKDVEKFLGMMVNSPWKQAKNDIGSFFGMSVSTVAIEEAAKKYQELPNKIVESTKVANKAQIALLKQTKLEADKVAQQTFDAIKRSGVKGKELKEAKKNAQSEMNGNYARYLAEKEKLEGKEVKGTDDTQKAIDEIGKKGVDGIGKNGKKQAEARAEIISELEKSLRAEANLLEFSEESFVNSYDIKYKLYLADLENARNNIKDKEKLKAKELEIEEKFTQEVQKLGKAESERLQKEREKFNDDVLKQIKDFGDERIALQKSIDKKLEDAEKEALDISRKNMLIDLDIDKLNRIAMAKNNDEIIKIENEHREKLRTLRIRFEAEDIASLQKSLDAKKAYTDNLKYEYWDKLQKDQRYSEEQRLDLMTAFTDKMDKEFEDYAINNALQQQKLTNNIVEINKEGYKQQADDAAKGRQKLIDDINDANKEIEKVLGKRKEMVIQSLRFFTNNTVRSLENFLEFYENTENKVSQINAKMIKGIIKQGQDFSRSLKDINLVRIKDLDKTIELAEKNLDNLKKVINKKTEDQTEEEKGLIAKGMDSIKDLKTKKFVEQIAAAGAAAQALLQITNTFLTARREKEIAAAEEEIERLRTEWTTREGVLNEEFEKRMAKIDENTAIESAKVDEAYLSSLAKLATNQADANTLLEGFLAQRAAINAKYADLIASTDESIANRAKEMRDKELADLTANTEAKLGLLVTNKDAITALEQKKEDDLAQIQKDANFKKLEEEKLANEKKRKEKFEQDKKIWEAQKKALDAQHKLDVQNFKFQKAMAVVQIGISTAVLAASLGAKTLGVGIIAGLAMGGALLAMAKLLDPPAAPEYPAEPDFANYEIGTDNTSVDARKSKRVDNKGGYNAVLHPEEAVFSKKDMAAMTKANNGIRPTRADVIDVFKSHKNIMYNLDTSPTIAPYVLNGMIKDMGLREELINVKKEIVGMRQEFMKPSVSVNLDKRGMNVYEQKRSHTVKKMSSRYRIKI